MRGAARRRAVPPARPGRSRSDAPLAFVVFALAVGTALAAVAILPVPRAAQELLRPEQPGPAAGSTSSPSTSSLGPSCPSYFPGSFTIETAFYAGALPLMLAIIALLRADGRAGGRRRGRRCCHSCRRSRHPAVLRHRRPRSRSRCHLPQPVDHRLPALRGPPGRLGPRRPGAPAPAGPPGRGRGGRRRRTAGAARGRRGGHQWYVTALPRAGRRHRLALRPAAAGRERPIVAASMRLAALLVWLTVAGRRPCVLLVPAARAPPGGRRLRRRWPSSWWSATSSRPAWATTRPSPSPTPSNR